MLTKTCFRCKQTKPHSLYYSNKATDDGLSCYCKECTKEYHRTQILLNPEYRQRQIDSGRRCAKARGDEYREYHRKHWHEYIKKHPEVDRVKNISHKIKIVGACYFCTSTEHLVRHHFDYSKPDKFFVLCRKCHLRLHKLLKITVLPKQDES